VAWWREREENDQAWKVEAKELLETDCNLDRKNPRAKPEFEHMPPGQLVDEILEKELRIVALMKEVQATLGNRS